MKRVKVVFPKTKIKEIMLNDEDIGKIATVVLPMMSKAVEQFISNIVKETNELAQSRDARTITVSHLKHVVEHSEKYDFLAPHVADVVDLATAEEKAKKVKPKSKRPSQQSSPSKKVKLSNDKSVKPAIENKSESPAVASSVSLETKPAEEQKESSAVPATEQDEEDITTYANQLAQDDDEEDEDWDD